MTDVAPATIRPRNPPFALERVPRHWLGGHPVATHIANAVNLLFPAGERFFVRSVHHYAGQLRDPALRAQVQGFFGQEGRHANAHEKYFDVMRGHGLRIDRFLAVYEKIAFGMIEPAAPPALRLAVTVALEHFTAILAEDALTGDMMSFAHPEMARLLAWHAAEEIEHKSVAFDVLRAVNPSYALRMAGMGLATLALAAFWAAGTAVLLAQERERGVPVVRAFRELRAANGERRIARDVFLRGIRAYLRRDFHPAQHDNARLAADYLASAGLA